MTLQTLSDLCNQLQRGEVTSVELTERALARAEEIRDLNAFITLTPDGAMQRAKGVDEQREKGAQLPELAGVPMAHKDIFCTQGVRTTCGSRMLNNFISPYDATVVANLAAQQMPMIGKLNMDEFAMGSSNESSYYGPACNPWNPKLVPGGSSGGSAVAVAAGVVSFATATDTGGSIRQPGALCNLVGLKPTYGRVSRYGMIAFASSLDQAGTLTHSVEDAALVLKHMAGYDERDATSLQEPVPDYTATLNQDIKGLQIGIPTYCDEQELDPEYQKLMDEAQQVFLDQGAVIERVEMPHAELAVAIYYVIAPAEASSNLARYDGVNFGHRCNNPQDLQDLYRRSRSEGFGDEVKRRMVVGAYVLSQGFYDEYYLNAQKCRQLVSRDYADAFAKFDLIMMPTVRGPAFELGSKVDNPLDMYMEDLYTIAANLTGLPAISLPVGFVKNLPVGMQLIAPSLQEARLFNAGHRYQQATDWHLRTPEGGQ